MSLSSKLLALLAALAVAFASGWGYAVHQQHAKEAHDALAQSESNRETEHLQARNKTRIADAITSQRLAAVRDSAVLRDRLREQSAIGSGSKTIAACRSDDSVSAARVLPDDVGADLVGLMEQAEAVSARLRACQALLTE